MLERGTSVGGPAEVVIDYPLLMHNFYEFGTNARNRLGLSTKILRIVSSGTPA